jgi:NADH-quinone oxidoreductase subunit G
MIEFFENKGITIPHYCYHKDLSIAGNCRMCLVEVKKSLKHVVSCAMNAKSTLGPDTVVYTNSPLVKKARESVMEFLLLNHPLDCPICDQGGECDLQDQSLFFGITKKRFYNFKRVVTNKNLGPIIKTVMTRCIHCTRCVRFAKEIAGVENLGTFGRGVEMEIGTYVEKTFDSELSGNLIDICPVGALTCKPYPFMGRSWELKKLNSIDPMDGFASNIQVFLKNNVVVKILPGFNSKNIDSHTQWISDKTRFAFEGMVATTRNVNKFIYNNTGRNDILSWRDVFSKLVKIMYFFDHLNKHCLRVSPFLIMFEETVSLEIISVLLFLKKKYSFFNVKKAAEFSIPNDLEKDFQINSAANPTKLWKSDFCLLIGINPRYESPYLNQKLKKRFSRGNFKIFSFNSRNDTLFPVTFLGSNLERLKKITEGNNFLCKFFKDSQNLITVINDKTFNRPDSKSIFNLISIIDKFCSKKRRDVINNVWNSFNLLNNSLNATGITNLINFGKITNKDLKDCCGMFFVNSGSKIEYAVSKMVELKLLNTIRLDEVKKLLLIDQNNKNSLWPTKNFFNIPNYMYIPNNTFFETFGSYMNAEGDVKKSNKLISSMKNTKDDWQLLRKLLNSLRDVEFISDVRNNEKIVFNCRKILDFRNLINFLYLSTKSLSNASFNLKSETQYFHLNLNRGLKKVRLIMSQLAKWLEDFYLGGFDNYCKDSDLMINCSMTLRKNNTTFLKN